MITGQVQVTSMDAAGLFADSNATMDELLASSEDLVMPTIGGDVSIPTSPPRNKGEAGVRHASAHMASALPANISLTTALPDAAIVRAANGPAHTGTPMYKAQATMIPREQALSIPDASHTAIRETPLMPLQVAPITSAPPRRPPPPASKPAAPTLPAVAKSSTQIVQSMARDALVAPEPDNMDLLTNYEVSTPLFDAVHATEELPSGPNVTAADEQAKIKKAGIAIGKEIQIPTKPIPPYQTAQSRTLATPLPPPKGAAAPASALPKNPPPAPASAALPKNPPPAAPSASGIPKNALPEAAATTLPKNPAPPTLYKAPPVILPPVRKIAAPPAPPTAAAVASPPPPPASSAIELPKKSLSAVKKEEKAKLSAATKDKKSKKDKKKKKKPKTKKPALDENGTPRNAFIDDEADDDDGDEESPDASEAEEGDEEERSIASSEEEGESLGGDVAPLTDDVVRQQKREEGKLANGEEEPDAYLEDGFVVADGDDSIDSDESFNAAKAKATRKKVRAKDKEIEAEAPVSKKKDKKDKKEKKEKKEKKQKKEKPAAEPEPKQTEVDVPVDMEVLVNKPKTKKPAGLPAPAAPMDTSAPTPAAVPAPAPAPILVPDAEPAAAPGKRPLVLDVTEDGSATADPSPAPARKRTKQPAAIPVPKRPTTALGHLMKPDEILATLDKVMRAILFATMCSSMEVLDMGQHADPVAANRTVAYMMGTPVPPDRAGEQDIASIARAFFGSDKALSSLSWNEVTQPTMPDAAQKLAEDIIFQPLIAAEREDLANQLRPWFEMPTLCICTIRPVVDQPKMRQVLLHQVSSGEEMASLALPRPLAEAVRDAYALAYPAALVGGLLEEFVMRRHSVPREECLSYLINNSKKRADLMYTMAMSLVTSNSANRAAWDELKTRLYENWLSTVSHVCPAGCKIVKEVEAPVKPASKKR